MPSLELTDFNIVCSILGLFITAYGLISYVIKERFYLSDALVSFLAGVLLGPALNIFSPLGVAQGDPENIASITYYFSRLVLGVQLIIAGIQLPKRYLLHEWKALAVLLLPGLTAMWLCSSLLIWLLVPDLPFLHALAIGACVSPTDPVLSSSIVKGGFADKNVPVALQRIIMAESGANDGLGYPFLFLPLFLMRYAGSNQQVSDGVLRALERWLGETWMYVIFLSILYGALVGFIAKELLRQAEARHYVDKESFTVFAISLALLVMGTCGLIDSDDILACFIAGNAFTFDDWFRIRTMEDTLQPTIDLVLNMAMFIWLGIVCPWSSFIDGSVVPVWRLFLLGILVLLLRRLPAIYLMRRLIPQITGSRDALFMGFFGPIGVSAIFYCCLGVEFLRSFAEENPAAKKLQETMVVVVWFLVTTSIIVHGLCIPFAMSGKFLTRSVQRTLSRMNSQPLRI
ncbi:hypothetical protein VTN77DRAFT_5579 [Rasamsonia byssochlamydoides]|uniref:uncharacterized protein n=1 Tax=Rasamsonia byssochlamydoides TaxID=89139 RepID=UPI0037442D2B